MKIFIINFWLLLYGQQNINLKKVDISGSDKEFIEEVESYLAKNQIEGYSAKSAKDVVIELPEPWPDVLDRSFLTPYFPLPPMPPINPRKVTEINPR